MALFQCHLPVPVILELIEESAKSLGLAISRPEKSEVQIRNSGFIAAIRVSEESTSSKQAIPGSWIEIYFLLRSPCHLCFQSLFTALTLLLLATIASLIYNPSLTGFIIVALFGTAIVTSIFLSFSFAPSRRRITHKIGLILDHLSRQSRMTQVEHGIFSKHELLVHTPLLILFAILCIFVVLLVSFVCGPLFSLILVVPTLVHPSVMMIFSPRTQQSWKSSLVLIQSQWTLICFFSAVLLGFLLGELSIVSWDSESKISAYENFLSHVAQYRESSLDPYGYVRGIYKLDDLKPLVQTVMNSMFFGSWLLFSFVSCSFISGLAPLWDEVRVKTSRSATITPPVPDRFAPPLGIKILVISHSIVLGILSWIFLLVSIDVFAYALFSTTAISVQLEILFALLELKSDLLFGFEGWISPFISGTILFSFSLPGGVILAFTVRRSMRLLSTVLFSSRKQMEPIDPRCATLSESFIRLCEEKGEDPPKIRWQAAESPLAHATWEWPSGRAIVISTKCISLLTQEETEALMAHELYHVNHDLVALAILRGASYCLLLPGPTLCLLLDFTEREFQADRYAANFLRQSKRLASALVKVSIFSSRLNEDTVSSTDRKWHLRRSLSFLFNDSIMGAAYPCLEDRLRNLEYSGKGV